MSLEHGDAMLELAAAYGLGAVDATTGECAAIREHIAVCALCAQEYRRSAAAAVAVGRTVATRPPPKLLRALLGELAHERAKTFHKPLSALRWLVPAAVACAIALAAGIWWGLGQRSAPTWQVACAPSAPQCGVGGELRLRGDRLELDLHGLRQPPANKVYQAWIIPPGSAAIPEPVFAPDAGGNGHVWIAHSAQRGAVVAVTLEPAGGSLHPTAAPFVLGTITGG